MANVEKVTVFDFPGERTVGPLGAVDGELAPVGRQVRVGESRGLVLEAFGEVVCQEMSERQFEVDSFDAALADPDLLEEGLVVGTSEFVGCLHKGLQTVGDQGESGFEVTLDLIEPEGARVQYSLGLGFLGGDPRLLLLE